MDYCNSLMSGMADSLVQKVQSVQNTAARLVSWASRRDHITSVLRELHWLPVLQRIHFKLGSLMYKSLSGKLLGTWRMMFSLSLTADDVGCDLPVTEPVSFYGLTTVSATEASLLLDPEYGMLYRQNSDMTSALDYLGAN